MVGRRIHFPPAGAHGARPRRKCARWGSLQARHRQEPQCAGGRGRPHLEPVRATGMNARVSWPLSQCEDRKAPGGLCCTPSFPMSTQAQGGEGACWGSRSVPALGPGRPGCSAGSLQGAPGGGQVSLPHRRSWAPRPCGPQCRTKPLSRWQGGECVVGSGGSGDVWLGVPAEVQGSGSSPSGTFLSPRGPDRQSAGSGGATPRARMGGARGPRDTRTGSAGSSEGRGVQCQAPGRRGSVVARSHAGRGLQRAHRQPHTTRHPGPRGSRPAPPLRAWGSFRNPTGTFLGRAAPLPLTRGRDGRTWCPRTLRPPRTQSNAPCCSGKSQMQTSLSLQTAGWYRHRREV